MSTSRSPPLHITDSIMTTKDDKKSPFNEDELDLKSKTQVKKDMQAIQEFGAMLIDMKAEQLNKLPLDSSLRDAVDSAKNIHSNIAKKRQIQFIGKILRKSNYEELEAAYQNLVAQQHELTRQHPVIEHWRDRLLADENAFSAFVETFPECDRQQLRQILREAKKQTQVSVENGKTPSKYSKKLFRFILDILSAKNTNTHL